MSSLILEVPLKKKFLVPGKPYNATLNYNQKLLIYCYRGVPKHLLNVWQTAFATISLNSNEYDLYKGSSADDVLNLYQNEKVSWTNKLFSWKSNKINLDPFDVNCIGIDTVYNHVAEVNVIRVDFWRVLYFGTGVFLFLAAPNLSSNPLFYYVCGITLGVTTSIFIGLYLISKLVPKKPTVYAVFVGGWAVAVYLFHLLWENIKIVATIYYRHALTYVVVTGLVSFILCYRFGPITDPRSKNLIKWTMQTASLILIFYSTQCLEASVFFDVALLLYYNFMEKWYYFLLTFWRRLYPRKRTYLSEDEYHEEGARETVKALNNLRQYCASSECNQWKTILSLQKPLRFAQFMEGSSHLEDSEILAYESKSYRNSGLLTDDSDSNDDD
ncbi:hypothetical protein RUM43_000697 [Polyplax serrata]|uniref:Nuclear envelope integral membrane protein 1 n=1 Tax=Polyplax serrata TaxID=468196 RepID=A0AAN8SCV8_POLSC